MKSVKIYTDGACIGNPGPGGFAAILDYQGARKEIAGGYRRTTNNRMELRAVIAALEALKEPCSVDIFTDSMYIKDSMTKGWVERWRARGWKLKGNKPAKNVDLWKRLLELCERHQVRFHWVRGHAGHPENERCDELSVEWAAREDLPEDPIEDVDSGDAKLFN